MSDATSTVTPFAHDPIAHDALRHAIRQAIRPLAARYAASPKSKRAAYSEQETREYFILPLMRALGWDTENPYEFSAEESIAGKYADFGFYLNGVPVFYLATKRVRADLDDDAMKQAISYAYNRGIAWAILTNFEQLIVLNAERDFEKIADAKFITLTYDQYAESGFDDLWLLSKPALSQSPRPLNQRAERYGKIPARIPVTDQLYKSLSTWRDDLFRSIYKMGDTLWSRDPARVDNAVQKLLDRLIFIRSMEDRGIESPILQPLVRQTRGRDKNVRIYADLQKQFSELNGIYNSNLFAPGDIDLLTLHDPDLIVEIINGLYAVQSGYVRYQFDAIRADVLGAVYEQYLAYKAQDAEGKRALDTRKSVKRKTQGIYYTPQYIVRYIVRATLGRLLDAGADAAQLRVLDPACGSGSFLIEAFDWFDAHYKRLDPAEPASERGQRILRHNLYGVDLDPQAVEVTRLNLALRAATAREKLPMLGHIQCGDSLVDDPAAAGDAAFRWDEHFPAVMAAGGFDAVIGNPPYVRQESLTAAFKQHAAAHYQTHAGSADLYVYFFERAAALLRPGGAFGMIAPNKWLRAGYGKGLRAFLAPRVTEVIDFGDLPVFKDATTYPCIVIGAAQPDLTPHPPPPSPLHGEGEDARITTPPSLRSGEGGRGVRCDAVERGAGGVRCDAVERGAGGVRCDAVERGAGGVRCCSKHANSVPRLIYGINSSRLPVRCDTIQHRAKMPCGNGYVIVNWKMQSSDANML
jgi:SAM-dependent methyltransferase